MLEEVQAKPSECSELLRVLPTLSYPSAPSCSECSELLRVLPTPKLSECSELLRVLPPKLSELLRALPTLLIRFPRKQ